MSLAITRSIARCIRIYDGHNAGKGKTQSNATLSCFGADPEHATCLRAPHGFEELRVYFRSPGILADVHSSQVMINIAWTHKYSSGLREMWNIYKFLPITNPKARYPDLE